MLKVKNLSKTYVSKKKVETHALKGASAEFLKGEIIAILGPSGSGKTTLLNVLSGFDSPDSRSEIFIDGISTKTFKEKNWDNYRNYQVGYVFQDNCLIEHLSALDNVASALSFSGMRHSTIKKMSMEALNRVGLSGLDKKYPSELSGGQQQLVSIARAIVKNPDIILADEPTGSLDSKNSMAIMDVLKEVAKGKLLIVASHNEKLVKKYSDKIYYLDDGILDTREKSKTKNEATANSEVKDYAAVPTKEKQSSSTIILKNNKIKTKKSSISLRSSIWSAYSSLRYRKLRSFLMFLAGAVGVIAVGVVLSFSNGLNSYITQIQNSTLAQYPITFGQTRDLTKIDSYNKQKEESEERQRTEYQAKTEKMQKIHQEAIENNKVSLNNKLGSLLSTSGESTTTSPSLTVNDLFSFKKYLDTNPDNFNDYVLNIEYAFRTSPVIYAVTDKYAEEVFPNNFMFGSLGSNSGSTSVGGTSKKQGVTSAYSLEKSLTYFGPLPENEDVFKDDDCLVAGHWPTNPYEVLLVLNDDSTIDDSMLYYLGIRDFETDIQPLLEKYANNEKVDFPGQYDTFDYKDFLDCRFKMINPSDCYKQEGNIFVDMSADIEYMTQVLQNAKDLRVCGVVLPKQGSRCASYLNTGIQFPYKLYKESIEQTTNSPVVQAQLNNPDIDILTGATFAYLNNAKGIADRLGSRQLIHFNLEMLLGSIKINPEALDLRFPKDKSKDIEITEEEFIEMMIAALADPDFQEFIHDLTKEGHFDEATLQACVTATEKYLEYAKEMEERGKKPLEPKDWFKTKEGHEVVQAIVEALPEALEADIVEFLEKYGPKFIEAFIEEFSMELCQFLSDLFEALLDESGPAFIEFDAEKFSKAIGINFTRDDMNQLFYYLIGATEHTYKGNLADFGYDDMTDPVSIAIYPKDYQSKTEITRIIDEYNEEMTVTEQESKFVTYNDDATSVISSAQVVVALVATVIIFFLSSIFVSSTLLIGVIFGLSTISRRREVGLLRALGARKRDVARMFSTESTLIGIFAGVLGVIISMMLCVLINSITNFGFDLAILPIGGAIALILVSSLLMFIAGFVPARIASKKDPVRAIRGL